MNVFSFIFFYKILAKYSLKRTKLHHFLKFSWGSNPPSKPLSLHTFTKMPIYSYICRSVHYCIAVDISTYLHIRIIQYNTHLHNPYTSSWMYIPSYLHMPLNLSVNLY